MNDQKISYVYIYKDPITRVPFYVGKGKNGRVWDHLKQAKTSKNSRKLNKIRKIYRNGLKPVVQIYRSSLFDKQAIAIEISLIRQYGRLIDGSGCLTNMTLGGDGFAGYPRPPVDPKVYRFVNRDGSTIHKTKGEMVKEIGLHYASLTYLVSGGLTSAGGWFYDEYDPNKRTSLTNVKFNFKNIFTDQEIYATQRDLSQRFGLSAGLLSQVVNGSRNHTGGWSLDLNKEVYTKLKIKNQNKESKHKFIHYKTGEVRFLTTSEFKSEIKDTSKVLKLIDGSRNHINGWCYETIKQNIRLSSGDQRVHLFENIKNDLQFRGTQKEFREKYNLSESKVGNMVRLNTTTNCGWKWCEVLKEE